MCCIRRRMQGVICLPRVKQKVEHMLTLSSLWIIMAIWHFSSSMSFGKTLALSPRV